MILLVLELLSRVFRVLLTFSGYKVLLSNGFFLEIDILIDFWYL